MIELRFVQIAAASSNQFPFLLFGLTDAGVVYAYSYQDRVWKALSMDTLPVEPTTE